MSIANAKGGFNTTLRVQQNSSNEALCSLQKPFLKKSENWAVQVTDFFINVTPELNRELTEQFRIVSYEGPIPGLKKTDYIFIPQKCYTVCEYAVQLQEFFRKFGFLFWRYGVINPVGIEPEEEKAFIDAANIPTTGVNFTKRNIMINPDTGALDDEGWVEMPGICSCSLDSDLRLNITLSPTFLANFFIHCEPHFVKRLGFPTYMFQIYDDTNAPGAVIDIKAPDSMLQVGPAPEGTYVFVDAVANRTAPPDDLTYRSDFTIRELDDRVSLDLVSTFPASRKINVFEGIEEHEYLLARFDLSSYKQFENVYKQDDERMLGTTEITENFQAGLENLTRGNPDFESNHLLSGSINQVHLLLFTRYLEHNKVVRVPTDVTDGFWHTRMLFSKKT